jgi:excinuclease ABC subunit C
MDMKKRILDMPQKPGVYIMKDNAGRILYIGKAKNLKKRLTSYFRGGIENSRTQALITHVSSIETTITDNEIEALMLENNLIKRYKPKYNIELKENNQYPYLKITKETYPRIVKTRIRSDDGGRYFGPYTNVKNLNRTIRSITDIFPIRRCSVNLDKKPRSTPCINYHLKKCACPCCGYINREQYNSMVHQVIMFLRGHNRSLLRRIGDEMEREAESQNFERAIELRERYRAIEHLLSEQKITSTRLENDDIIGMNCSKDTCAFTVMKRREGKIIGKNDYTVHVTLGNVMEQFLLLYYEDAVDLPDRIHLPSKIDSKVSLHEYFRTRFNKSIRIYVPQKGVTRRLVDLACRNAEQHRKEEIYRIEPARSLGELRRVLKLGRSPHTIEAFDVATTLGTFSVASMVRFSGGKPDKKQYRKFRIRFVEGQNDIEMLKEAVARRYQRVLNDKGLIPDLIMVDGGRLQVQGARHILDNLGLQRVPVIGLAKKHEEIYLPDTEEPFRLERRNDALRLLMALRDEAHRFANTFHITLRSREALLTKLETLPGIGDSLALKILTALQDSDTLVTMDSLLAVKGLGTKKASDVYRLLTGE